MNTRLRLSGRDGLGQALTWRTGSRTVGAPRLGRRWCTMLVARDGEPRLGFPAGPLAPARTSWSLRPGTAAPPACGGAARASGLHHGGEGGCVIAKMKSDVAARISAEIDKAVRLSERGLHDAAWQILKAAQRLAENIGVRSA